MGEKQKNIFFCSKTYKQPKQFHDAMPVEG
jgi:hypothetical protein